MAPLFTKLKIFHFNPEERYSQVSRLSDTRFSAKGPRGDGDMQAASEIVMRQLPAISNYGYLGGRPV